MCKSGRMAAISSPRSYTSAIRSVRPRATHRPPYPPSDRAVRELAAPKHPRRGFGAVGRRSVGVARARQRDAVAAKRGDVQDTHTHTHRADFDPLTSTDDGTRLGARRREVTVRGPTNDTRTKAVALARSQSDLSADVRSAVYVYARVFGGPEAARARRRLFARAPPSFSARARGGGGAAAFFLDKEAIMRRLSANVAPVDGAGRARRRALPRAAATRRRARPGGPARRADRAHLAAHARRRARAARAAVRHRPRHKSSLNTASYVCATGTRARRERARARRSAGGARLRRRRRSAAPRLFLLPLCNRALSSSPALSLRSLRGDGAARASPMLLFPCGHSFCRRCIETEAPQGGGQRGSGSAHDLPRQGRVDRRKKRRQLIERVAGEKDAPTRGDPSASPTTSSARGARRAPTPTRSARPLLQEREELAARARLALDDPGRGRGRDKSCATRRSMEHEWTSSPARGRGRADRRREPRSRSDEPRARRANEQEPPSMICAPALRPADVAESDPGSRLDLALLVSIIKNRKIAMVALLHPASPRAWTPRSSLHGNTSRTPTPDDRLDDEPERGAHGEPAVRDLDRLEDSQLLGAHALPDLQRVERVAGNDIQPLERRGSRTAPSSGAYEQLMKNLSGR